MNTRNNKRKKQSQETIQKVFIELIQNKEIEEITVTDICQKAKLNRSTFYANYLDIYDLAEKIKEKMLSDFDELYKEERNNNYNSNDFLKLFRHIKKNQLFYKTFFKLKFDIFLKVDTYDYHLAEQYYNNQNIDYHIEFFRAGINAVIKKWLNNNCCETPEEIMNIIKSEYNYKN